MVGLLGLHMPALHRTRKKTHLEVFCTTGSIHRRLTASLSLQLRKRSRTHSDTRTLRTTRRTPASLTICQKSSLLSSSISRMRYAQSTSDARAENPLVQFAFLAGSWSLKDASLKIGNNVKASPFSQGKHSLPDRHTHSHTHTQDVC